eukprot:4225482-Pleurochrysis_carterae.AAC.2
MAAKVMEAMDRAGAAANFANRRAVRQTCASRVVEATSRRMSLRLKGRPEAKHDERSAKMARHRSEACKRGSRQLLRPQ